MDLDPPWVLKLLGEHSDKKIGANIPLRVILSEASFLGHPERGIPLGSSRARQPSWVILCEASLLGHPERANKGESKDLGAIKTIAPRFVRARLLFG